MTNDNNIQDQRCATHVRVVVHDATVMPDPEIRAIARFDMRAIF